MQHTVLVPILHESTNPACSLQIFVGQCKQGALCHRYPGPRIYARFCTCIGKSLTALSGSNLHLSNRPVSDSLDTLEHVKYPSDWPKSRHFTHELASVKIYCNVCMQHKCTRPLTSTLELFPAAAASSSWLSLPMVSPFLTQKGKWSEINEHEHGTITSLKHSCACSEFTAS